MPRQLSMKPQAIRSRKYRAAHPDADRDYYEANRPRAIERAASWADKNRDKSNGIKAAWKKRNPGATKLQTSIDNARRGRMYC